LCHRVGAPADYLVKHRPGLRALILRAHFAHGRGADRHLTDENSCIISRGDRFLDFGRTDLFSPNASAVLDAVIEGVGADAPTLRVQKLQRNEESFTLELVTPRQSEEVRVGDVICGGLRLQHSFLDGPATRLTQMWSKASHEERVETITHEACHIIADYRFGGRQRHGPRWQEMMRRCGYQNPQRCHRVDQDGIRARRLGRRLSAACGRPGGILVTPVTARRVRAGTIYLCRACGQQLTLPQAGQPTQRE
jgi:predicted SprT family Zn-dependent metalloprotease